MHPTLFEYWWRDESARVQQQAEMTVAVKNARLERVCERSSWAVQMWGTVGSGRRLERRNTTRVLTFREQEAWLLGSPIAGAIPFRSGGVK